eukprot:TRINITY_DN67547_c0_g1_i1.p1 TRINITY_DN67547_c0_g1~~TRINITY_DN67547_c0_g1_i1.p1  ORF type:complete len:1184 (-),score=243.89 TRINITY_DN67547_c0_g1_i1:62-3613(-)
MAPTPGTSPRRGVSLLRVNAGVVSVLPSLRNRRKSLAVVGGGGSAAVATEGDQAVAVAQQRHSVPFGTPGSATANPNAGPPRRTTLAGYDTQPAANAQRVEQKRSVSILSGGRGGTATEKDSSQGSEQATAAPNPKNFLARRKTRQSFIGNPLLRVASFRDSSMKREDSMVSEGDGSESAEVGPKVTKRGTVGMSMVRHEEFLLQMGDLFADLMMNISGADDSSDDESSSESSSSSSEHSEALYSDVESPGSPGVARPERDTIGNLHMVAEMGEQGGNHASKEKHQVTRLQAVKRAHHLQSVMQKSADDAVRVHNALMMERSPLTGRQKLPEEVLQRKQTKFVANLRKQRHDQLDKRLKAEAKFAAALAAHAAKRAAEAQRKGSKQARKASKEIHRRGRASSTELFAARSKAGSPRSEPRTMAPVAEDEEAASGPASVFASERSMPSRGSEASVPSLQGANQSSHEGKRQRSKRRVSKPRRATLPGEIDSEDIQTSVAGKVELEMRRCMSADSWMPRSDGRMSKLGHRVTLVVTAEPIPAPTDHPIVQVETSRVSTAPGIVGLRKSYVAKWRMFVIGLVTSRHKRRPSKKKRSHEHHDARPVRHRTMRRASSRSSSRQSARSNRSAGSDRPRRRSSQTRRTSQRASPSRPGTRTPSSRGSSRSSRPGSTTKGGRRGRRRSGRKRRASDASSGGGAGSASESEASDDGIQQPPAITQQRRGAVVLFRKPPPAESADERRHSQRSPSDQASDDTIKKEVEEELKEVEAEDEGDLSLLVKKKKKIVILPEVPRLRSAHHAYAVILHNKFSTRTPTVRRSYADVAAKYGLSEADWNMPRNMYRVDADYFKEMAEHKRRCNRLNAATKLQKWWRAKQEARRGQILTETFLCMKRGVESIQEWWHIMYNFRLPLWRRAERRKADDAARLRAALKIQAIARGWQTRRSRGQLVKMRGLMRELHSLNNTLTDKIVGDVTRVQALMKGLLAYKTVQRLREERDRQRAAEAVMHSVAECFVGEVCAEAAAYAAGSGSGTPSLLCSEPSNENGARPAGFMSFRDSVRGGSQCCIWKSSPSRRGSGSEGKASPDRKPRRGRGEKPIGPHPPAGPPPDRGSGPRPPALSRYAARRTQYAALEAARAGLAEQRLAERRKQTASVAFPPTTARQTGKSMPCYQALLPQRQSAIDRLCL